MGRFSLRQAFNAGIAGLRVYGIALAARAIPQDFAIGGFVLDTPPALPRILGRMSGIGPS